VKEVSHKRREGRERDKQEGIRNCFHSRLKERYEFQGLKEKRALCLRGFQS